MGADLVFGPSRGSTRYRHAHRRPIVNRSATDRNLPTLTYDTLTTEYPSRTPGLTCNKSSHSIIHSVHVECTLAGYLASLGRPWTNIEIGCSKDSCWLCELYLSHRQAGLAFHAQTVHGRLLPGWTMPEGSGEVLPHPGGG